MEDIILLVPAYNPDERIMEQFLQDLTKEFTRILIVDDGSKKTHLSFFQKIEKRGIPVLHHETNRGKGRAIKTGFEYILSNYKDFTGVITADCDGQHTVSDIKKCALKLRETPNDLIVGCRNFDDKNVPERSKFGNKLTRSVFKIFIGISITDTQSGLRGFSEELMKLFLKTEGERYEYETNMLIDCKKYDINIQEVMIQTVYLNHNQGSHFNPIKDSLKIYKLFFKYIVTATSSFILDIAMFSVLLQFISVKSNILIATILARIISSVYNFILNYKFVFRKGTRDSIWKYIILAIFQMFVSGYAVTYLAACLALNKTIIKIMVDTFIFIINFIIQREWVFQEKKKAKRIPPPENLNKKILMIINPVSGRKKRDRYFSKIRLYLRKQGYDTCMKFTTKEHSADYIIQHFKKDYDYIITCGGDGTLSQLIQGLYQIKRRVPIGFIPCGTTNDYARSLHIPTNKKRLSKNFSQYEIMETDLGIFNQRTFNYAATFGLFSKTSYSVSRKMKNIFGRFAYILSGIRELFSYQTYPMRIEHDGEVLEDSFAYGSISNSRYIGGFHVFRRQEIPMNDGKFEVLLIRKPKNFLDTIVTTLRVIRGNFKDKDIFYFKTDKLHITSLSEDCRWSIDGEYGGNDQKINISVVQKWSKYLIP